MRETWASRTFDFHFPVGRFGVILDRIRGTPHRMEAKLRGLDAATLIRRPGESWSLQEHVGHFLDLDRLHWTRLEEIRRGAAELSPHDMRNQATWDADYNARQMSDVMADFVNARAGLVAAFEAWDPSRLDMAAFHRRIGKPMRVVDLAYFIAEHDDYYLAEMQAIIKAFGSESSGL